MKIIHTITNRAYLSITLYISFFMAMGQFNYAQELKTTFPSDATMRYGKLDNGFTYYIRKNDTTQKSIELHLVINAGSHQEDNDQREYAHLMEHMGGFHTTNFPNVVDQLRILGRYSHAQTSREYTKYMVRIPSADKEGLQLAFQYIKDLSQGKILMDQSLIDVQRGAVLGEMRNNNPYISWRNQQIRQQTLRNSKYRSWDREKAAERIRNFNRDAFVRFKNDWYHSNYAAAIIVGDIDVDSMETKVRSWFSDLKPISRPHIEEKDTPKTIVDGTNSYKMVLDTVQSNLRMYMVAKRKNSAKGNMTRLDVQTDVYDQLYEFILQGRISKLTNSYTPFFKDAYFNLDPHTEELRRIYIPFEFRTDSIKAIKKQLIDGMRAWKGIHKQLSAMELESAKTSLRNRYSGEQVESNMMLVRKYRMNFVNGDPIVAEHRKNDLILETLDAITLEGIQDFADKQADLESNKDFVFFGGRAHQLPDLKKIEGWLHTVNQGETPPLIPEAPQAISFDHQMDLMGHMKNISVEENLIGVRTYSLPNDIKLLLKPNHRKNASKTININAFNPNGMPVYGNRKEYLAALVAPEVIAYLGAGGFTKFDLDTYMRAENLSYRRIADFDGQRMTGKCNVDEIGSFFNMVHLFATQPRKDERAFRAWKTKKRLELMGLRGRGSSEFYMDKVKSIQYNDVPMLTLEELESLTLKEIFDAYTRWFTGYSGFTFVVTGGFDPNEVAPELIRYISSLPASKRKRKKKIAKPDFDFRAMNEKIELNNTDQLFARLYFPVKVEKNVKNQVLLKLLSKALRDKIYAPLRAGCYSPTAFGQWKKSEEGIYTFVIRFDSELGNEEHLVSLALEEFRKLRDYGVDETWLKNAIYDEYRSYEKNMNSSFFWTEYLHDKSENGVDPTLEVSQYMTVLKYFIDVDDVNKAAKKYLSEAHLQQFLLVPQGYSEQLE